MAKKKEKPLKVPPSKEKVVMIGLRVPESLRIEIEDAAHLVDYDLSELIISGIKRELAAIRAQYGDIPPRPRRLRDSDPPAAAGCGG
jgi:hypothetical protein